ncbi:hypothetical protein F4805DRAFT_419753 [Annulohypoxylon moriforme]|nr:hypothetical protein F4805DRAFT_419753 [Annulohypoxylon moriforme]
MEPSQPGVQQTAWAENVQYQPRTVQSSYGFPREYEPQFREYPSRPAPNGPYQVHTTQQPPMFEAPMRPVRQYDDAFPPTQPQPVYYVPVYGRPQPYTHTYPQNMQPIPIRDFDQPGVRPIYPQKTHNEDHTTIRETRYGGDLAAGKAPVNEYPSLVVRQSASTNERDIPSSTPTPPPVHVENRRIDEHIPEDVGSRSGSPLRIRTRTIKSVTTRRESPNNNGRRRSSSDLSRAEEVETVRRRAPYRGSRYVDSSDSDDEYIRLRKSEDSDARKIKIKRSIRIPYRDRSGRLKTETHSYKLEEDLTNKQTSSISGVPTISLTCSVNEQRTLKYYTIKVTSWMFINYLSGLDESRLHSNVDSGSIVFREPFVDLFHRRRAIQKSLKLSRDSGSAAGDTELDDINSCSEELLSLLASDFPSLNEMYDRMTSHKPPASVEYANLWMIYTPGTMVFRIKQNGGTSAYLIDSVKYEKEAPDLEEDILPSKPILTLYCWSIDYHQVEAGYDGKFGRRDHMINIPPYKDYRPIRTLEYIPERFTNAKDIKTELIARGRIFWGLSGPTYREVVKEESTGSQKGEKERVMVDYGMYQNLNREQEPSQDTGLSYPSELPTNREDKVSFAQDYISRHRLQRKNASIGREDPQSQYAAYYLIEPSSEPTDLMLMLCPPRILAFSLLQKYWSHYNVAQLRPVQFQNNAWSRIVLDQEYKDVVQAMVASYLRKSDTFQDLVPGKGAGISILLHGPPGVGKTLTAECVAESFQKPLYMVTAGDLGTDPETLEFKLSGIFDLAVHWDAILLLDEADVFLQDRDYENLTRNALVSIFLRTLEYFKGIMFLTSNRVGAFDQAFQSRIHITLGIPEFNESVRKQVWAIFIKDLGRKRIDGSPPLLTEEECKGLGQEVLKSWSREPLNGRQIRNCVRSALALAQNKQEKLCAKHFNTVIRLGNTFTQYMTKLQKVEADELAQVKGDRLAEMGSLVIRSSQLGSSGSTVEDIGGK